MAKLIIAGSKVHALDRQGLSPGHRAAQFGQDEVLQTLLHAGLDVEFMSGRCGDCGFFGFEAATPLHIAARFGHGQVRQFRECSGDIVSDAEFAWVCNFRRGAFLTDAGGLRPTRSRLSSTCVVARSQGFTVPHVTVADACSCHC